MLNCPGSTSLKSAGKSIKVVVSTGLDWQVLVALVVTPEKLK